MVSFGDERAGEGSKKKCRTAEIEKKYPRPKKMSKTRRKFRKAVLKVIRGEHRGKKLGKK